MKVTLFALLGLLCVQASLQSAVRVNDPRFLKSDEVSSRELTFYSTSAEEVQPRLNIFACIPAVKEIGKVIWESWTLWNEKRAISKRAKDGTDKCNKNEDTTEREKCLKDVKEKENQESIELYQKIWALVPKLATAGLAVFKCLF